MAAYHLQNIFVAISLAVLLLLPDGYQCCKTVDELDQCVFDVNILANPDLHVPTNDAEMQEFCGKAHNALSCVKDHVQECSKGAAKPLMLKVFHDVEEQIGKQCNEEEARAEFVKHVQCLSDPEKMSKIRLCSDKHLVVMEKVSDLPKELRLPGSCCTVHAFRHCAMTHLEESCGGESSDYFNDLINELAEENSNLICKKFADMAMCDANFDAETWNEYKSIMESDDPSWAEKHHSKTIVPIIMKMLHAGKRRR